MKSIARIMFLVIGGFIMFTGLKLMFDPAAVLASLKLSALSVEGSSHARAILGGAICACGISSIIAAVTAEPDHARATAMFVILVIVGRVVGFIVDGLDANAAFYIVPPVVVLGLLITAHKLINVANARDA